MVYNSEQSSANFLSENRKDSKNSAMLTKNPNMRKIFCAFLLSIFFLTLFCFVCSSPCIAGEGHYKKLNVKHKTHINNDCIFLQDDRVFFPASASIYNPVTNEFTEGSYNEKRFGMNDTFLWWSQGPNLKGDNYSPRAIQLKNGNILYVNVSLWASIPDKYEKLPDLILYYFNIEPEFNKIKEKYPIYCRYWDNYSFDKKVNIIRELFQNNPQNLNVFERGLSVHEESKYVWEYNIKTKKFIKKGSIHNLFRGKWNPFQKLIPLSNGKVAICMRNTVEIYDPETGKIDSLELDDGNWKKFLNTRIISKTKDKKLVYVVTYKKDKHEIYPISKDKLRIIYIDLENKKVQESNKEHDFGYDGLTGLQPEVDLEDGRYIFSTIRADKNYIWYKKVYLIDFNKDEIKYLGELKSPRCYGNCVRLDDKKIMFVGGVRREELLWKRDSIWKSEIFDIETGESVFTPKAKDSSYKPQLHRLKDGRIFILDDYGYYSGKKDSDPTITLYVPKNWKKEK